MLVHPFYTQIRKGNIDHFCGGRQNPRCEDTIQELIRNDFPFLTSPSYLTILRCTLSVIFLQTWRLHVWDQSSEHILPCAKGMHACVHT